MNILVITRIDAANLSIENIVRRMVERGHHVDIYACYTDYKSIRMFEDLSIDIYPVSKLNRKTVQKYDIAFTTDLAMRYLRFLNIYVFSYNYVPDTWISEAPDFMFTMVNDRKLEYEEDCAMMPIGCAKNDKKTVEIQPKKQILYIDAGHNPFGEIAKRQVAGMILSVCANFSNYSIVIKPRWLKSEMTGQTHRSSIHIYDVLDEMTHNNLPGNLIMLEKHKDLQQLIDESESVITTSVSSYFDVALRGKGCIIACGFDCEEGYDTRPSILNAYKNAEASGCCVDYRNVVDFLPQGIICNAEHLKDRLPYLSGVSDRIVKVMEFTYQKFISKGIYPDIKKYNFETYQEKMTNYQNISLNTLKNKRFKNGALIIMRMQEHVNANIDKNRLYRKICKEYVNYPMNEKGYKRFLDSMEYERKKICVEEQLLMQTDAIDQSIFFQALYDTGKGDDFLTLDPATVLCEGPYHYYLGLVYAKYNQVNKAIKCFTLFLEKALKRSYDKYPQESEWGLKNSFNYVFNNFNESNIEPAKLAYLCLKLCERDVNIVDYNSRKRIYCYLPVIAEQVKKEDTELAYLCLLLYVRKRYDYEIKEKDNKISVIEKSISYRLGRGITFPLRFTLNNIEFVRQNGIRQAVSRLLCKKSICNLIIIWKTFHEKVMRGYSLYSEYTGRYGLHTHIYLTAPSRGDTYILSSFFRAFLEKEGKPACPVFIGWSESCFEIANLFGIENIESVSTEDFWALANLSIFNHGGKALVDILHFHLFYLHTRILGFLMGFHGMNLLSLSAAALGVLEDSMDVPDFICDEKEVEKVFADNGLLPGHTVVLSPYAKTVRAIPMTFWIKIIDLLKKMGFTLCTNVTGTEKALPGTIPVFIPFHQSILFLKKAGITIGVRSGFQDVTCTADCLKISVMWENLPTPFLCCSPEQAFCLKDMYHRRDQFDFVYNFESEEALVNTIIKKIIEYQSV